MADYAADLQRVWAVERPFEQHSGRVAMASPAVPAGQRVDIESPLRAQADLGAVGIELAEQGRHARALSAQREVDDLAELGAA